MLQSLFSYQMAQSKYIWNNSSNILCTWFDLDNYLPQSNFYLNHRYLWVRCLAAYSLAFAYRQAINFFFAEYEMKMLSHKICTGTRRTFPHGEDWRQDWGFLSISQALLRLVLLYTASPAFYHAVSSVYGGVLTPLFLVFSFWFPKWY